MVDVSTLGREAGRIADAVRHWSPARWRSSTVDESVDRAQLMSDAIQRVADAAADAEGQPRRPVPAPDSPVGLTDQWRVVMADLLAADPGAKPLHDAHEQVARLRSGLW